MITQYIKGNIVEIFSEGNDIAHGCNCLCVMGAGVAGQLRSEFPQVFNADEYEDRFYQEKRLKLGLISIADHINDVNVCYNLYTQYNPGPSIDYGALLNCFIKLNQSRKNINRTLYIPRIGSGIAGGDWKIIEKLINIATPNIKIVVVDYDADQIAIDRSVKEIGEAVDANILDKLMSMEIYEIPKFKASRLP